MTVLHDIVVHILGHAGTGKLTVARALQPGLDAALIDSHLINNPIFAALGVGGGTPVPPAAWTYTQAVRAAVLDAIENCAPMGRNYIFTNVVYDDDPHDLANLRLMRQAFARKGLTYIPVRLQCAEEELLRRRVAPGRAENRKDISVDNARRDHRTRRIVETGDPHELTLDVTALAPEAAAQKILAHIQTLVNPA